MTSNIAEVYNWVLRGSWGLPLVGIVESVLHGTTTYFQDRYSKASLHIQTYSMTPYCAVVMAYMAEKSRKGQGHMASCSGNVDRRFEITLRHRTGFGVANEEKIQKVDFDDEAGCACTCNKPMLYHKPCSHVLAAAALTKMERRAFVSPYFTREAVLNTWSGELWGYRIAGSFTTVPVGGRIYIPMMTLLRQARGGRQRTRRIRNDMDESEVGGPTRQCLYCMQFGHRMNRCSKMREDRLNEGETSEGQSSTAAASRGGGTGRRRRAGGRQGSAQGHGFVI